MYHCSSLLFRSVNMSIVLMLLTDWWYSGREHFVPRTFECKILDKKSCIQLLHFFLKELWKIDLIRGKFLFLNYFCYVFSGRSFMVCIKLYFSCELHFLSKNWFLVKSFVHKCFILLELFFISAFYFFLHLWSYFATSEDFIAC